MTKYDTLCLGDFHIKDLTNSSLDSWQYKCYIQSFKNIVKIIEKHKPNKLILLGDTFDTPPKNNSLELFARFMSMLKPFNLEVILIDGNHCLLSGAGRRYYCESMKDYFKLNYNIEVLDYKQDNDILYCSHKHIDKLEKVKPTKLVYSHFRSNIYPTVDEIDITAINKNVELCVAGDIHFRLNAKNIVYTGTPVDVHFDSNNELESHTPSVLLLNEETLKWKWETTLSNQYRKKKKIYASAESFLNDVENLREDFKTNHNFYKVVIQDRKVELNRIKKSLYEDFCIMNYETLDLDYNYENRKISVDIVKNLSTNDTSKSFIQFCEKNLTKPHLRELLLKFYHRYETTQKES